MDFQATQVARTLAKTAFLAFVKKEVKNVIIELSDCNFNSMNGRFDIHFNSKYSSNEIVNHGPGHALGSIFFGGRKKEWVEYEQEFNLKCDFDGCNATIKPYNDKSWTSLGSLS